MYTKCMYINIYKYIYIYREIDVFYGDGAPSGPNYLLFVDADRLADSLADRSGVG